MIWEISVLKKVVGNSETTSMIANRGCVLHPLR